MQSERVVQLFPFAANYVYGCQWMLVVMNPQAYPRLMSFRTPPRLLSMRLMSSPCWITRTFICICESLMSATSWDHKTITNIDDQLRDLFERSLNSSNVFMSILHFSVSCSRLSIPCRWWELNLDVRGKRMQAEDDQLTAWANIWSPPPPISSTTASTSCCVASGFTAP